MTHFFVWCNSESWATHSSKNTVIWSGYQYEREHWHRDTLEPPPSPHRDKQAARWQSHRHTAVLTDGDRDDWQQQSRLGCCFTEQTEPMETRLWLRTFSNQAQRLMPILTKKKSKWETLKDPLFFSFFVLAKLRTSLPSSICRPDEHLGPVE